MSSIEGGAKIARELTQAGTADKRQEIGARAIDLQQDITEEAALNDLFAKRRSEHPFLSRFGSEGVFTTGAKSDLPDTQLLLAKSAMLAERQVLSGLLGNDNTKKAARDTIGRLSEGEGKASDVALILDNLSKSKSFQEHTSTEQTQIKTQLEYQLKSITFQGTDEEYKVRLAAIEELKKANVQELALRRKYNAELENFISKGLIIGTFQAAKTSQGFTQEARESGVAFSAPRSPK